MRTIRFLLSLLILAIPAASFGQIGISVAIGPPAMPSYDQPICPGDGYLWTPGYWAYDQSIADYYWVPGTWVQPPEVGVLWTPGYWGWGEGGYFFNEGYWGPEVGFYGGINYGFGYWGNGYSGGRWDHGQFFYNRAVNNLDVVNIRNLYSERVENNNENRVSYNGGRGGIASRPTQEQAAEANQRHIPAVAAQTEHAQTARANPVQHVGVNHGNPPVATTSRPASFNGQQLTGSSRTAVHPNDLAPIQDPAPANSGNAKADKKYQQQQDNLIARQNQERQSLQQKQDSEHQQLAQQKANDARTQQVEQQHQQQTQQLSDRHAAQQQALQSRQPQARPEQGNSERKH